MAPMKVKKRYEYGVYACAIIFFPAFIMLLAALMLTALYMDGFISDEATTNAAVNFLGSFGVMGMLIGGVPVIITGMVMMFDPPKDGEPAWCPK